MSEEITVLIVDKDSPAFNLVKRGFVDRMVRPGDVLQATKEELDAWRKDVEIVTLIVTEAPGPERPGPSHAGK